jgi:3-oxoacyl-[acyl-carrier-protein] synthase-3
MKERRIADETETCSYMGAMASKQALTEADIAPEDVDLIICATTTPDYIFPSTACLIQHALGCINAAAFDIQAACTGYLYALSQAKAYIESGQYSKILIVACEKLSSVVDYQDRNTCVLFGDGAAAALVTDFGRGLSIADVEIGCDGEQSKILHIPGGGSTHPASEESIKEKLHYIKMQGKEVFKHAVRRMEAAAKKSVEKMGIEQGDISWFVPHQANIRIIESIAKRFEIPMEQVFVTIHKYGNTSASSIGISLHELLHTKSIKNGENLLLVAFGAGLTWGSSILVMEEE